MSEPSLERPILRTACDRQIGRRARLSRPVFTPVTKAEDFVQGITGRLKHAGGRVARTEMILSALQRAVGLGSVHRHYQFGINLILGRISQQILVPANGMYGALRRQAIPTSGELGRSAPLLSRADLLAKVAPDRQRPSPVVRSKPILLRPHLQVHKASPGEKTFGERSQPWNDRQVQQSMTRIQSFETVEMIGLRMRREIAATEPAAMQVRRNSLPLEPSEEQWGGAQGSGQAGHPQPGPTTQAPNVRHLADEVLSIIDRRVTAERERLERR